MKSCDKNCDLRPKLQTLVYVLNGLVDYTSPEQSPTSQARGAAMDYFKQLIPLLEKLTGNIPNKYNVKSDAEHNQAAAKVVEALPVFIKELQVHNPSEEELNTINEISTIANNLYAHLERKVHNVEEGESPSKIDTAFGPIDLNKRGAGTPDWQQQWNADKQFQDSPAEIFHGKGDPSGAYRDYPENSSDVRPAGDKGGRHTQRSRWQRWREWVADLVKTKDANEQRQVGREEFVNKEKGDGAHDDEVAKGEGDWNYPGASFWDSTWSPTTFNAAPAMKLAMKGQGQKMYWDNPFTKGPVHNMTPRQIANKVGEDNYLQAVMKEVEEHSLSLQEAAEIAAEHFVLNKESAFDPYLNQHISITFDFTPSYIKVVCTWDSQDIPQGLDEVQTLARIVQFLEQNLPEPIQKLKNLSAEDIDIRNRTISFRSDK